MRKRIKTQNGKCMEHLSGIREELKSQNRWRTEKGPNRRSEKIYP